MSTKTSALTPLSAAPAADDTIVMYDTSAVATKGMTVANLMTGPAIASPILSGTVTGTYTIGGSPTIATPTVTGTMTAATIAATSISTTSNADLANNLVQFQAGGGEQRIRSSGLLGWTSGVSSAALDTSLSRGSAGLVNLGTGAANASGTLGVSTIELGAATDTTLSRSAAGTLAVEGVDVLTTSGTQTATNKTLTSPVVTTGLTTGSGTFALLNTTATTVNAFGATTTLNIGASATCVVNFGGSTTASELRFLEPSGSGTNYTALKAGAQAANITYTWPPTVASAGQFLKDAAGDGVLSWSTPSGSGDFVGPASSTDNAVVRFDGTTGKLGQNSAVTIADTTGDISTAGSISVGVGATTAGAAVFTQGTTQSTGTTSITLQAPTGVTSYIRTLPGAVGSSGFLLETVSGSVQTESLVAFSGTGNVARVDSPTFTTAITLPAVTGTTATFASTTSLILGTAGSAVGNIGFKNATSGTATVAPPTGALGTYTVTLPNAASTLPIFGQQITFTGPTAARSIALPDAAFTVARTDAANTFTGVQSMTSPDITTSITSTSGTLAVFNTTTTTVNAFGATSTLNIGASATCIVNLGGSTSASELRFLEPSGSGTNYTALKCAAQAANITYTFPATAGAAGTFLRDNAGNGILDWAAPSGSGTVTNTGGNLTSNSVVIGAGTTDTKVLPGFTTDGTSILTLGVAGTSVGTVAFKNATSGTVNLLPVTGALGTVTLSLPAATDTLVGKATTDTLTNKTLTSPTLTTPVLGTPTSGALTNCTADGTNLLGYRGVPQQSKSAAYTTVLGDAGFCIFHPVGDNNARTFTIDSNANVAYPIGTCIEFVNMAATASTVAITSDTMTLIPAGTTGSRTLAQYGKAVAEKITSTSWIISGNSALT